MDLVQVRPGEGQLIFNKFRQASQNMSCPPIVHFQILVRKYSVLAQNILIIFEIVRARPPPMILISRGTQSDIKPSKTVFERKIEPYSEHGTVLLYIK